METPQKQNHYRNRSGPYTIQSVPEEICNKGKSSPLMPLEQLAKCCDKLISTRLPTFCKQFCYDNRHKYQCTVDKKWGVSGDDVPLCEWGNAGYAWMLKELCDEKRIGKLESQDKDTVVRYLGKIINSTPFRERFKDWRFQRRIRIPDYIRFLDPDASRIFWWLYDGDNIRNIAQRLGRKEQDVARVEKDINAELRKRKKSYLLKNDEIVSLNSMMPQQDDADEFELPSSHLSHEDRDLRAKVNQAYQKLSWQEQYVLDAMIVDELSAKSVLQALQQQNLCLDGKTPAHKMTDQNIYYFLRKTIARLKDLAGVG